MCGVDVYLDKNPDKTEKWSATVMDVDGERIDGCSPTPKVKWNDEDERIDCPELKKKKIVVRFSPKGTVRFVYGAKTWKSDDPWYCDDTGFGGKDVYGIRVSITVRILQMSVHKAN